MNPTLSRIRIYPIKSLDPVELQTTQIGKRSLRHDREFAMLAANGRAMNGKRSGRVNELCATYDLAADTVHLAPRSENNGVTFHLIEQKAEIEKYLSDFFNEPIVLLHNTEGRLMDIPDVSSVTIVSDASLESLRGRLSEHSLDHLRLRFRANLELTGVDAFWEETLIGSPGNGTRLRIGEVEMIAVSPRARCNVPPRDPLTGISDKTFVRRMVQSRTASMPGESPIPKYGSMYHLTINTYLPDTEIGKWLRVGDDVEILSPVNLAHSNH